MKSQDESLFYSNDKVNSVSFENVSYEEIHDNQQEEIFENYSEDIDFMESDEKNQSDSQIQKQIHDTLNSSSSSFEDMQKFNKAANSQNQQEPSYQIKAMMQLIQSFKKDRQKLHENMAHCLFCIYNQ